MITRSLFNLFLSIYLINEACKSSTGNASYVTTPRQFQYLEMDSLHRGSFNITDCVRELLNCWEVVRPDIICSDGLHYESVCGVMKRDCTEKSGLVNQRYSPLFLSICREHNDPT